MRTFVLLFMLAGLAAGDTLTFTMAGTGTGHWGSQTFSNANFTFQFFVQDAEDIMQPSCCAIVRSTPPGTPGTVTVSGFGSSAFGANGNQAIYVNRAAATVGIWHYNLSDFLTVANTAFSNYDLTTSIGPVTGTTFSYPLALDLGPGVGLAFTSVSNVTFTAQRAPSGGVPSVTGVLPAFGNSTTGVPNLFEFTIGDTAGAADLQGMNILFSDNTLYKTGDPYACWMWFSRSSSSLSLYNRGNWQTAPAGAGGSVLTGDSCSVDTATAAIVTGSGNDLTLKLPVTLLNHPPEPDNMRIYVRAVNNENVDTGYRQTGTFIVYPGASPNFTMTVYPTFRDVAVGSTATYTVAVVPKPGFHETVNLSAYAGVAGATSTFNPPLITGEGLSTLTVTTADIPNNTYQYQGGGYSVNVTGESTSGQINQAVDMVVEIGPPQIEVNDRLVSGLSHVYTVTVKDILAYSNWATGITGFNLLIAPAADGRHACWVFYDGTTLWLASDDGLSWMSAGPLGTTRTAQNSQCMVGGPAGSPGPRLYPHAGWLVDVPITFTPGFASSSNILWLSAGNQAGLETGYFPWIR